MLPRGTYGLLLNSLSKTPYYFFKKTKLRNQKKVLYASPLVILSISIAFFAVSCDLFTNPNDDPPINGDPPVYPLVDGFPAWSPDGLKIIYNHNGITRINIGGSYQVNPDSAGLWMINADGINPHLILKGNDINANWSPDGEWIIFEMGAQIYKVPFENNSIDVNKMQQLTSEGQNYFPAYAPDGEWIAYDSDVNTQNGMQFIWKMRVDGSEKTRITYSPEMGEIRMPGWSPDGRLIVHQRYIGVGAPEIFSMDNLGNNSLRLTNDSRFNRYPKYSPDGNQIAFQSSGESVTDIVIINPNSSGFSKLVMGLHPCWSPNSQKIAFVGFYGDDINDSGTIWIINVDGTNLTQLTFGPDTLLNYNNK